MSDLKDAKSNKKTLLQEGLKLIDTIDDLSRTQSREAECVKILQAFVKSHNLQPDYEINLKSWHAFYKNFKAMIQGIHTNNLCAAKLQQFAKENNLMDWNVTEDNWRTYHSKLEKSLQSLNNDTISSEYTQEKNSNSSLNPVRQEVANLEMLLSLCSKHLFQSSTPQPKRRH